MENLIFKSLKPYLGKATAAVALKSTESLIDLTLPLIMAEIIDKGVMKQDINYVTSRGGFMILIATVGYLSAILCNYYSVQASQGFGNDLREKLFVKIQRFDFHQLNKFTQASLITRVTQDVSQIVTTTHMCMRMVLRGIVTGIGAVLMAFLINPSLSSILIIVVTVAVYLTSFYMKRSVPLYGELQKRLDKLTLVIRENLVGIRVVKALVRENVEKEKFESWNTKFAEKNVEAQNLMDSRSPFIALLLNLGICAILWFGGEKVNTGKMKVGEVVAFVNYVSMIMFSLNALSFLFSLLSKTVVSSKRINEVLQEDVEEEKKETQENSDSEIAVEFRGVYFSYEKETPCVLENLNFKIKRGENVAIIGGVGSGKTTLVSLIPRFYDATRGMVLVNGIDVKKYALKELRDKIGVVMQKSFLFSQSIEENIKWGKPEAAEDEVEEAVRAAQGEDFIEALPERYKTKVAKGGMNFSGGQKQRLSIARTLIKSCEILIFDDSFSALDFITESKLKKEISRLGKEKTIITISQRISSIKGADKIIVLDNGKIAGIGTHKELLESSEIYSEICQSQEICTREEVSHEG